MEIKVRKLKNGLRLVSASVPGVESCTVQVFVKAGSRDEDARVGGLAHFLEHMVFKGTLRYPSAQAISSLVDSVGAEINASTDKERTSYYLKLTRKHIDLAFDVLSDMVFSPKLEKAEIEREKGVIVQEIAMYEDLPPHKVASSFEELLYGEEDPLGRDTAGKAENVKRITQKDFVKFRRKFYRPENMVLSIAGSFDQKRVEELTKKWFGQPASGPVAGFPPQKTHKGSLLGGPPARATRALGNFGHQRVKLVTKKTEQAHVVLGFHGNPRGHKDRYVEVVLSSLLGGGMSSRLFTEVREKRGLAYYIRSDVEHFKDAGYFTVRAGVELGKVEEAIAVILEQFRGIINYKLKIENSEALKSKEYFKGRFLLHLEDTEAVSDFFGEHELLEGKVDTVNDVLSGIDAVTSDDLYKVAGEFFRPERLNLAIVGPYKDPERFEKLLRI